MLCWCWRCACVEEHCTPLYSPPLPSPLHSHIFIRTSSFAQAEQNSDDDEGGEEKAGDTTKERAGSTGSDNGKKSPKGGNSNSRKSLTSADGDNGVGDGDDAILGDAAGGKGGKGDNKAMQVRREEKKVFIG